MSEISLTASMRSNLLSLQQIAKLQDSTQLRLSTGLKVNSAIDNPSSYYTASSLNNRAEDLSALLDSMGQSVQTIKAATEGIEKAEDLLSQMKAIAEQVNTGVYVPEKSYFEKLVGSNGAVVSTADELRAAVDSGKEEICVYGKIDLGDISTEGGLQLQENQKLVGVNYYGNYGTEGEAFSSISATSTAANNMIDIKKTGCLVSDLSLNYGNSGTAVNSFTINIDGLNTIAKLRNLNIISSVSDSNSYFGSAIFTNNKASTILEGNFNIEVSGQNGYGITTHNSSTATINSNTKININNDSTNGFSLNTNNSVTNIMSDVIINISGKSMGINVDTKGVLNTSRNTKINIDTSVSGIRIRGNSVINIESDVNLNIKTSGNNANGIGIEGSSLNVASGSNINIETSGGNAYGFQLSSEGIINLSGNVQVKTKNSYGIYYHYVGDNILNITSQANIYLNTGNAAEFMISRDGNEYRGPNTIEIAKGAKIAMEKNGSTKWYEIEEDYEDINYSTTTNNTITADNIEATLNVAGTDSWETAGDIIGKELDKVAQEKAEKAEKEAEEQANREVYQKQYNNALSQYDSLIKDSSYKGVNLLQADDLKVIFNENRSSTLEVSGVDLSSDKIGMMSADWTKAKDVQNSINQVIEAKNTLRSAATKLGNYYSIITERETFTDNLINVLEEGADKLTLADMNEESANMLSLQTQQQLAINSLSLASQASQAVLRLF